MYLDKKGATILLPVRREGLDFASDQQFDSEVQKIGKSLKSLRFHVPKNEVTKNVN